MTRHQQIWNPPPFSGDYKVTPNAPHNPWTGLARLMTILEDLNVSVDQTSSEPREGKFLGIFRRVSIIFRNLLFSKLSLNFLFSLLNNYSINFENIF